MVKIGSLEFEMTLLAVKLYIRLHVDMLELVSFETIYLVETENFLLKV